MVLSNGIIWSIHYYDGVLRSGPLTPAGTARVLRPRRVGDDEGRLKPPFAGNVGIPLAGRALKKWWILKI
ncbi:hypothetical protein CFK37_08750 [Virgibacillus phasianinus]|uniref:Uncharacterized protein n=1 Tax=Virgibacillus phasianinus TaxID=2017483 RepID=A0A220U3D7_9BACI|nr:hypothetical protein CFK37_08750 [Virgibacillus phasianinus]